MSDPLASGASRRPARRPGTLVTERLEQLRGGLDCGDALRIDLDLAPAESS